MSLSFTVSLRLSLFPLSDTTGFCKETKTGEVYKHVLTRLTDGTWRAASHLNLNFECINCLKVWTHFSKVSQTTVTCNVCERILASLMLKYLPIILKRELLSYLKSWIRALPQVLMHSVTCSSATTSCKIKCVHSRNFNTFFKSFFWFIFAVQYEYNRYCYIYYSTVLILFLLLVQLGANTAFHYNKGKDF